MNSFMNKLWKANRKSLKRLYIFIYFLMFFSALFAGSGILSFMGGDENLAYILMAFVLSTVSLGVTITIYVTQTEQEWDNIHRAVGGNIPSKEVDKSILVMYQAIMVDKGLKPLIKRPKSFSTNRKASMKLVKHIGEHCFTFKEDVFKQTYTCVFMYNWDYYEGTSASKEMAICMAIKQAYDAEFSKKISNISKLF